MKVNANGILSRFAVRTYLPGSGRESQTGCGSAAATCCDYRPGPRITCLDRAVIDEYFRECRETGDPHAAAAPAAAQRLLLRELPAELEHRLSRLPVGLERAWKGSDLLLIETASGRVIDIARWRQQMH